MTEDEHSTQMNESTLSTLTDTTERFTVTNAMKLTFDGQDVRTIMDGDGNPWFVAKDVCGILGIRSDTIRKTIDPWDVRDFANPNTVGVCDTPEIATILDTLTYKRGRAPLIVSESGLYTLALRSRKENAETFRRWVTHDVLPSIRRDGMYATHQTVRRILNDPDVLIGILERYKAVTEENRRQALQIEAQRPKAEAYDDFMDGDGTILIRDAAKMLGNGGTRVREKELRHAMRDWGWCYRDKAHKAWRPTAYAARNGWLALVPAKRHGRRKDGTRFDYEPTMRLTRAGFDLMRRKLHEAVDKTE